MKNNSSKTVHATYSEAVAGKPFQEIDKSTIPTEIIPSPHSDMRLWSPSASEDLIDLAHDIYYSALPSVTEFFEFPYEISGIRATDLFSLNSLMGATIEDQVVKCLNKHRETTWDRAGKWREYSFVRSAQAFPDVRLVHRKDNTDIKIGIELKSWFMMAKEGVPSMRYAPHPDACAELDMLCIIPWYLSNAVCGKPIVASPWIQQAKYAAEFSMFYWKYCRKTETPVPLTERGFKTIAKCTPYPQKSDKISLHPLRDSGGNYGRLPRYSSELQEYCTEILKTEILGIPAENWRYFLQLHTDAATIESVKSKISQKIAPQSMPNQEQIINLIYDLLDSMPENLIK